GGWGKRGGGRGAKGGRRGSGRHLNGIPARIALRGGAAATEIMSTTPAVRLALFQPDIAPNAATILRLCACLSVEAHIIEPAGFPTSDRAFRPAGMDYLDEVALGRPVSWAAFEAGRTPEHLRPLPLATP